jgi:hypothetical protein
MSLISEDKSTVGNSNDVVVRGFNAIAKPVSTIDFPLSQGFLKQKVGYATPRAELWTPFYDADTGLPMQLPQGYMFITYYLTAKMAPLVSPEEYSYWYFELVSDPLNPDNDYYEPSNNGWYQDQINHAIYAEEDEYTSGNNTLGYNYPFLYNDYYLYPNYYPTSGVVKLVIFYI